jgi:hypothetical protein
MSNSIPFDSAYLHINDGKTKVKYTLFRVGFDKTEQLKHTGFFPTDKNNEYTQMG